MAFVVKMAPVAILSLLVFRSASKPGSRLAACGLALSALADGVIEWSFLGGLVVFLLAHLFYIAAFSAVERRGFWVRLLPVGLWAAVVLPLIVSRAGGMAWPVLIYGLVIFTMIWRAAAAVTAWGWNVGAMGLCGALLFGLSDTLLGYTRFVAPLPASNLLILGTYWSAQGLIAASFVRVTENGGRQ